MGFQFHQLSGIEPFCVDQTKTTEFDADSKTWGPKLAERFRSELTAKGGVAGYLSSELSADSDLPKGSSYDANIFALENKVE